MFKYKAQLEIRGQCRYGGKNNAGMHHWLELDNCPSQNYLDDFDKPKIMFQEIVQEPCFMLDKKDKFMCLDTARIITGKNLDILLAVLNSSLFFYAVKFFYSGGGLGENGVRMKHTFFLKFPAPIFSFDANECIKTIIKNIDADGIKEIDKIIYKFYGLTDNEIAVIKGF